MTTNGNVIRHSSDVRIAAIAELAALGLNTAQIAGRLGIGSSRVSQLAKLAGIVLPRSIIDQRQRNEQIRRLAGEGLTSSHIADLVGIQPSRVRIIARRDGFTIVGDITNMGKQRRIDSAHVVRTTINQISDIGLLLDQVDYAALPVDEIDGWVATIVDAIGALATLRKRLKEQTQL